MDRRFGVVFDIAPEFSDDLTRVERSADARSGRAESTGNLLLGPDCALAAP